VPYAARVGINKIFFQSDELLFLKLYKHGQSFVSERVCFLNSSFPIATLAKAEIAALVGRLKYGRMGPAGGLVRVRELRLLVPAHHWPLSSPQLIECPVWGSVGDQMAITVQMQFESVVTEMYQEACVGSSLENGTTIITFDLRQLDFQEELGTPSPICWRQDSYQVDVHELSTFHNPMKYRFILAQGYYLDHTKQRRYFPPEIQGGSTSQHMSHSRIRLVCYLAVVCGVSLRPIALLFSSLFLLPLTKSSVKRWIDAIGAHLPSQEDMLKQLLALTPAAECQIDGYSPRGTDHCVRVIKDENGEDATQFLKQVKKLGLTVTTALSDYSQSFTEAIKSVYPQARFQADHFHTVKNIWGHLKKSLLSYRRQIKASGEEKKDEALLGLAQKLWKCRWSLLKKPAHLSGKEQQATAELESPDAGFVHSFRKIIRQRVNIFDYSHSELQAQIKLQAPKYLSLDIAEFIVKGPQMTGPPAV
jgi:hypothetical protein